MKKTKLFTLLRAIIAIVASLAAVSSASAQDKDNDNEFTEGDFNYLFLEDGTVQLGDGTSTAWAGTGYTETITIPATVTHDGTTYTVTKIGDNAFIQIGGGYGTIKTITFPTEDNHITSIGYSSFSNNSYLNNINLDACQELTTIGESAFAGSGSYGNDWTITFPNSITSIPDRVCENCSLTGDLMRLGFLL